VREVEILETEVSERRLVAEVTGRIQGVGYRYFVRTAATRLGVTGCVRNDKDGSVRVEAEGSVLQLNQLIEALRHGPSLASVHEVKCDWQPPSKVCADFTIRT
jgi:acylphosphatase